MKTKKIQEEIERKYLVQQMPSDISNWPSSKVIQGYIMIAENGNEVRLRHKGDKYYLTVKTGKGMVRSEYETEISNSQFEDLWPSTEGRRIEKVRYKIPYEGKIAELDEYAGNLTGLMTVEVEFKPEEDSQKFLPPDWFGKEITDDSRYKNQNLALNGLPK